MLPVIELRGAIPYGIFVLDLNPITALIFSIIGNFAPMYFILRFLDPAVTWIFGKSPFLRTHIEKYFNKLHHRHSEKFNETGYAALAAFVAIPIPGTGAWTGALLAYLFNLPKKPSLIALFIGIIGAGLFMAFFSDGIQRLFVL